METPYGEIPERFVKDMAPDEMFDYLKKRYSRRRVLKGAAAAGALAAAGPVFWRRSYAFADSTTDPSAVGPQWIAFGPDSSTEMYIAWSAGSSSVAGNVPKPTVRWGLDTTYGATIDANSAHVPTPAAAPAGNAELTSYQNALLTGLTPDTTYHYSVSNDGNTWGPDTTFTTGKTGVVDFRFAATGDENSFSQTSIPIMGSIASFKPDFTIVSGDLSYAADDGTYSGTGPVSTYTPASWDTYFAALGPVGQSIPWMVGPGNHDVEPFLDNGFAGLETRFPHFGSTAANAGSGSKVVQSFTYGNVGFVGLDDSDVSVLDTVNNGYTKGAQTSWFENQLKKFRAPGSGIDFIVVFFHHCPYCSGGPGSDGGDRTVWQPLFDQYTVDVVINGHNHLYERINPINGTTVKENIASGGSYDPGVVQATTYICTGGGGQSLAASSSSGWNGPSDSPNSDLASGAGTPAPIIAEYSGGETATGGSGTPTTGLADPFTGWSAFRKATFCHLIIDVTAPTTQGGQTSMLIRAIDPTQVDTTSDPDNLGGTVTSPPVPAVMDSITLTRTSVTGPGTPVAALPEAPDVALLAGSAALVAGGAYYLANRRHKAGDLTEIN
jgi:Calcineurin-like phosphoesterase/Purple acid Phosphatase, N-terminal domain/TAT (twin-arginine translocation) pathway signal sequence